MDLAWADGALTSAKIHSDRGNPCRLRTTAGSIHVRRDGQPVALTEVSPQVYDFSTTAGGDYDIVVGSDPRADTDGDGAGDAAR